MASTHRRQGLPAARRKPAMMAAEARSDETPPEGRSTEPAIAWAIDLGWCVSALHALSPQRFALGPPDRGLLLNHGSLPWFARVELELRRLAGLARRLGVSIAEADLGRLIAAAHEAPASRDAEHAFRLGVARAHASLDRQLWERDEGYGRAYELGNFVADTWNRFLRPASTDPSRELLEAFDPRRVQRIVGLLDDLQTRIDPFAAHAVSAHLELWRDRVRYEGLHAPELTTAQLEPVERQTVIWRQLLTGARDPASFLGSALVAQVREELSGQMARRYRRPGTLLAFVVLVAFAAGIVVLFVNGSELLAAGLGILATTGGAFRATREALTIKLMWERALRSVITRETVLVDELIPPPERTRSFLRLAR